MKKITLLFAVGSQEESIPFLHEFAHGMNCILMSYHQKPVRIETKGNEAYVMASGAGLTYIEVWAKEKGITICPYGWSKV